MLDSLEPSDRTSLNIKLKNDITLTGTGDLGFGASPFLWDFGLVPMFFAPNEQMIISAKSNNTGIELADLYMDLSKDENMFEVQADDNIST